MDHPFRSHWQELKKQAEGLKERYEAKRDRDPDPAKESDSALKQSLKSGTSEDFPDRNQRLRRNMAQQRMRERKITVLRQRLIVAAAVAAVFAVFYLLIANSYKSKFLRNTYLNGYNVGGMSEDEAEQVLEDSVEKYALRLEFQDQKKETLTSPVIGYEYVSSGEAGKLLKKQNRMEWLLHLFGKKTRYQVKTSFQYDESKLELALFSLPEFQEENIEKPVNAHMKLSNNEIVIVPETEGNQPNRTVVLGLADAAVQKGDTKLDLSKTENSYIRPDVTENDENLNAQVDDLNEFLSTTVKLVAKDGSTKKIGRKKLLDWISEDDGTYYVDDTNIADHSWNFVQAIADKYDDTQDTMKFKTTNLGTKTLSCDPYGYKIDVDEVADQLCQDLLNHKSETITIKNSVEETADPTFGGTYIEVDVTNQHVYFYKDGSDFFDTDCVTGLESDPERLTPSGVFAIYAKIPDKTLEGRLTADGPVTYTSDVSYWMPFYESYGLHDAPWRDEFGGTIYEESGSHGCVNLPVSAAGTIYNNAEVGTAVIVVRESD